jgi:hypothetical protein
VVVINNEVCLSRSTIISRSREMGVVACVRPALLQRMKMHVGAITG